MRVVKKDRVEMRVNIAWVSVQRTPWDLLLGKAGYQFDIQARKCMLELERALQALDEDLQRMSKR